MTPTPAMIQAGVAAYERVHRDGAAITDVVSSIYQAMSAELVRSSAVDVPDTTPCTTPCTTDEPTLFEAH